MIRRSIAAACLLIAVTHAQTITVRPSFTVGQKARLTIRKTREDSRQNRATGTSSTPVDIEVLKASAGGSLVRWRFGETNFTDPAMNANPMLASAARATAGIVLDLALSPEGEVQKLENDAEVTKRLGEMTSQLTAQLAASLPEVQRTAFLTTIKAVLSPQALAASAIRDAQLYFNLSGAELDLRKPVRVPMRTASPVGGGQIESQLDVELQSIDREAGTAQLSMRQTFDPSALRSLAQSLMGAQAPQDLRGRMFDEAQFTLGLTDGWMRRIRHKRTIEAEAPAMLRRVDTTEIELNAAPAETRP